VTGNTEFADEEGVERGIEHGRNFAGNQNPAAWQTEDEDVGTPGIVTEVSRQLTAGVAPVAACFFA
jgi:hypothetical protein